MRLAARSPAQARRHNPSIIVRTLTEGVLAFLVDNAGAHLFIYANAKLRKDEQNDEILRFVEAWQARTGEYPGELLNGTTLPSSRNLEKVRSRKTLGGSSPVAAAPPRLPDTRFPPDPPSARSSTATHRGSAPPTPSLERARPHRYRTLAAR